MSACVSDSIIHDNNPPTMTSFTIENDDFYTPTTAVTLNLAASDTNTVTAMYITNTSDCSAGGTWAAFAGTAAWNLPLSNDTNTVYVKFRDEVGNESDCESDSIIHSNQAPTLPEFTINNDDVTVDGGQVTLNLSAEQATEVYVTNVAGCAKGGAWTPFATSKAWDLAPTLAMNATVYVKFRSASLNETACLDDSINVTLTERMVNGSFEGNDLSGWTNSVDSDWQTTDSGPLNGSFSARASSVTVDHGETACLSQSVDLTADTSDFILGFTYGLGTEATHDFLEVSYDATVLASFWGNKTESRRSYTIPGGAVRVIHFCYKRNGSGDANGDYVAVDNVSLTRMAAMPLSSPIVTNHNERVNIRFGSSINQVPRVLLVRYLAPASSDLVNGVAYTGGNFTPDGHYIIGWFDVSGHLDYNISITDLDNSTPYSFGIYGVSGSAKTSYSLITSFGGTPEPNNVATSFRVYPGPSSTRAYWNVVSGGNQAGYLVVTNPGSPVTFTPTNGVAYNLLDALGNGDYVMLKGNFTGFHHPNLTPGTQMHYKVWAYGADNTYSSTFAEAVATPTACAPNGTNVLGSCWVESYVGEACQNACFRNGMAFNSNALNTLYTGNGSDIGVTCNAVYDDLNLAGWTPPPVQTPWTTITGPLMCARGASDYIFASGSAATLWTSNKNAQQACSCY